MNAVLSILLFALTAASQPATSGWIPVTKPTSQPIKTVSTQPMQAGPKLVVMKELENLYQPVPFDHQTHAQMVEMGEGCTTCHHRTPSAATQPASSLPSHVTQAMSAAVPKCKSCHAIDLPEAKIGMPNLKGAYHRQCLNCHKDWMHSNACEICHKSKKGTTQSASAPTSMPTKDDIVGRMHPPIPAPETKLYKARFEAADGNNVLFRHKEHTETFGIRCMNCHRRDSCNDCHDSKEGAHRPRPLQPGRTWKESHGPCISCHPKDRCKHCHFHDNETAPAAFDHDRFSQHLDKDHANLSCISCHPLLNFSAVTCGDSKCHKKAVSYPADKPGKVVATQPAVHPASLPATQPATRATIIKIRAGQGGVP